MTPDPPPSPSFTSVYVSILSYFVRWREKEKDKGCIQKCSSFFVFFYQTKHKNLGGAYVELLSKKQYIGKDSFARLGDDFNNACQIILHKNSQTVLADKVVLLEPFLWFAELQKIQPLIEEAFLNLYNPSIVNSKRRIAILYLNNGNHLKALSKIKMNFDILSMIKNKCTWFLLWFIP